MKLFINIDSGGGGGGGGVESIHSAYLASQCRVFLITYKELRNGFTTAEMDLPTLV